MKIIWFTWKDKKNPAAGGAEVVNDELAKRLIGNGHEVVFLVSGFPNAGSKETINGYQVIRVGNRFTVYQKAKKYYQKYLSDWADLIIEEVNTIPFFTQNYIKKEKQILIFHQLCREIWWYQIFFPLNLIGYLIEPIYLRLMNKNKVITISKSSKNDLKKYNFSDIKIIPMGTNIKPVQNLNFEKFMRPTILSLGDIRPMKRTLDIITAFEYAKSIIPDLQLKIAGSSQSKYGKKVLQKIKNSKFTKDIEYLGTVDKIQKTKLMQSCHLIVVTSVKEGWGLIISEAASQGTPAVVYNVDGLRDSVGYGETGFLCKKNNPKELSQEIVFALSNKEVYKQKQKKAYKESKKLTFDNSYCKIEKIVSNG
ncbi:MAG: glycosyltransferase family 4 protein [bacterium]|nr:glycosyltransferase family 4 protein [bacterium]